MASIRSAARIARATELRNLAVDLVALRGAMADAFDGDKTIQVMGFEADRLHRPRRDECESFRRIAVQLSHDTLAVGTHQGLAPGSGRCRRPDLGRNRRGGKQE